MMQAAQDRDRTDTAFSPRWGDGCYWDPLA